jgi:ABC-type antimicrobial peptide transport system ATPase subunit
MMMMLWRLPANHNCCCGRTYNRLRRNRSKGNYQLLKDIQQETGMSIIFISHDLSLVSEIAHQFW